MAPLARLLFICVLPTHAMAGEAPGGEDPAKAGKTTDAAVVSASELVRIVNPTAFAITATVTAKAVGQAPVSITVGPIEPGKKAEGTLSVWVPGELTVTASWEKDGDTKTARPYTAVLAAGQAIMPVTLTLDDMDMDGDFGIWKTVVWDEGAGGE